MPGDVQLAAHLHSTAELKHMIGHVPKELQSSFFDVLVSTCGLRPLRPYYYITLIISKNILSLNGPGPYLKSILLKKHLTNMLPEQCAFQICS